MRCERHQGSWDSDFVERCPVCEFDPPETDAEWLTRELEEWRGAGADSLGLARLILEVVQKPLLERIERLEAAAMAAGLP